jgi:cytochrome c oxidase cbb3-type subunit 3
MKFINYLESIAGVGMFPMISLGIFFTFFVLLTIWVLKVSKSRIIEMKNIPLNDSSDSECI